MKVTLTLTREESILVLEAGLGAVAGEQGGEVELFDVHESKDENGNPEWGLTITLTDKEMT